MIDLHIHTDHSDGTDNLKDILIKCNDKNLEIISITDHDTVDAYFELKNFNSKDYYNGKIISGIEIKTSFKGVPIEILGYKIDINYMANSSITNKESRIKIQNKYLNNFVKVGKEKYNLKSSDNLKIYDYKDYAATTYYDDIIICPENEWFIKQLNCKREDFYRLTSANIDSPFYISEVNDYYDLNFVIEEIHNAGGYAFLPHLFQYKIIDDVKFLEDIVQETNIDGIEVYYSTFTKEQSNLLLSFARKNNLFISGGTDYHGKNKPDIEIGTGYGDLIIDKEIIGNWIN